MPLSTQLFPRFKQELKLRNYAPRTIKAYVTCLRGYVRFLYPRLPREAGAEDIRAYLLHSLDTGLSRSYLDQTISALKFLYVDLYGRPPEGFDVPRPRREQALPAVPTRDEVLRIAGALENTRHRLAILLLYGCGLRASELVRARIEDVSLAELTFRVRDGKGRKDRVTVLPEVLTTAIEEISAGRPGSAPLIPARHGGRLTTRSLQHIVEKACVKAGVTSRISPHSFRHAFATHVLEGGTEIGHIQRLLGHARVATTRRYIRVRNPRGSRRSRALRRPPAAVAGGVVHRPGSRQQLAQAAVANEWKGTDLRKAIQATTAALPAEPPAPVAAEAPYTPPSSLVLSGIERTTDELTRLLVQWEGVARVTPEQGARVTQAVGRLRAGADALERSLGRAESVGGRSAREPSR